MGRLDKEIYIDDDLSYIQTEDIDWDILKPTIEDGQSFIKTIGKAQIIKFIAGKCSQLLLFIKVTGAVNSGLTYITYSPSSANIPDHMISEEIEIREGSETHLNFGDDWDTSIYPPQLKFQV